jgi:homoserine kinase
MLRIKSPATSANFGPGFDALGVALGLYNEIIVEKAEGVKEFHWDDPETAINNEENLILTTMKSVFNMFNYKSAGYKIWSKNCCIPMSRGLGSSAASIVAGIYAANYLMNGKMTQAEIAALATRFEGHPDNVVTCIKGGMVISAVDEEGEVVSSHVSIAPGIRMIVMVPDYKLSTRMARSVLPDTYSRADMVYNVSHAAMLVTALSQGDFGKLRVALGDRIHQPYRLRLIPGAEAIFDICRREGSLGEFISGAGPTLISLIPDIDQDFASRIKPQLDQQVLEWKIYELDVCHNGVFLEVI